MKSYKSSTAAKRAAYSNFVNTNEGTMVIKEELTQSQKYNGQKSRFLILPESHKAAYEGCADFTVIAIYNEL